MACLLLLLYAVRPCSASSSFLLVQPWRNKTREAIYLNWSQLHYCTNFLRIWLLHISGSSAAILVLLDPRSKFQADPWTFRQIQRGRKNICKLTIFTHTCNKMHISTALMSIPDHYMIIYNIYSFIYLYLYLYIYVYIYIHTYIHAFFKILVSEMPPPQR